ncbi:MAG TPA: hypothetical protein VGR67_04390 [Candidatus Polarisedimenticolia bacterium]|jgi:hypothetical protein|nr:hypothetical protein [Candidatus Polarisedimenticolia bacterium]
MKPAAGLSVLLLSLVSVAHLLRLLYRVEIVAAGRVIPLWASVPGALISATLAGWLWREQRR